MPNRKTGAIAVFVKTPGLSPIKTRLAASIGSSAAEWFHVLSAKAVESVVSHATRAEGVLTPYWAVAEKEALDSPHWKSFQTVWQGDGPLGERLSHVYDELIRDHSFVIFIGADCPHIASRLLRESAAILSLAKGAAFVLGRADDGGFYLFGGTAPIPRQEWLDIPYSVDTTASELAKRVATIGTIKELPRLLDVDTADDMAKLLHACAGNADLTIEQWTLLKWVQEFFEEREKSEKKTAETGRPRS